ncbi:hypothetical protein FB451DRAFT_1370431 [Mycena latifolia]|nr:hypothetical protein FB451DRAFT_1370431 [Mycena latifolia]
MQHHPHSGAAPHRAQRSPLRPAIKPYTPAHPSSYTPTQFKSYTLAHSTSSVWGGSTAAAAESDSDRDDTNAGRAYPTSRFGSSHLRAPGHAPAQQRRVAHWVHDTHPEFKPPFAATRSKSQHHHHQNARREERREPPPVWVPRPQQALRHVVSQPLLGRPQMAWVPAPPPARGDFGMGGNARFVLPPRTVPVMHAPRKHKPAKSEDRKAHGEGKRRH